jgi:DNA recombination protein RmuC
MTLQWGILWGITLLAAAGMALFWRRSKRDAGSEVREELRLARAEDAEAAGRLREEIARRQDAQEKTTGEAVRQIGNDQRKLLTEMLGNLQRMEQSQREESIRNRSQLEEKFRGILESNEKKLDQMRQTVDEKLQSTLEKRLSESFKLVGERLEAVHRGLGEMQLLAHGVGDLKRILTNVKERGTWGEYQLAAILEQILTPDQFGRNVRPTGGGEQVEFAVKLPGRGGDLSEPVWLPIDSKFPKEDYERLQAASANADPDGVTAATDAIARAIRKAAKDIRDKYICPPQTTDFAILFLPTEGLYAEILRQPGLHDELQQVFRVMVAGPTTLSAILNSLRIGFQTLAIEQRSHEVWEVLRAVKTEFGKFGEVLSKLKRQLATASETIGEGETRTRQMARKLKDVEALPALESRRLLDLPADGEPGSDDLPAEPGDAP